MICCVLATNFNGKLPIGYLPLQPSTGNPKSPSTDSEESSSPTTSVSNRRRKTTSFPTSPSTSSSVIPSTTVRSTTATFPVIKPTTTRRSIITATFPTKKTTSLTKRTTRKKSIPRKTFTPKNRRPTTTKPTSPRPTYHSYSVQYPKTVPLQGTLKDPYGHAFKGTLKRPTINGVILGGFQPILQKQKSTKSHFLDKQIPPTIITPISTTPSASFQNRYPTYKPQPDLVISHTTISTTTTPLYDPFQFQANENGNGQSYSGIKTKINPSKKLAFLKGVEKLRKSTATDSDYSVKDQMTFNRNRRTTGRPLFGVTVTPRSFPKVNKFDNNLPKRRRFQETVTNIDIPFPNPDDSVPNPSSRSYKQELARVPKSASSIAIKKDKSTTDESRRNMLMNIILRPGGGDKSKALPRPKVDVYSEGPNVIVVRMTFPENENIQGLRAYTPDPVNELEKLADIERILPENASIERISAISSDEFDKEADSFGIPEDVVQTISNAVAKNSQNKFAQLNQREKLNETPPPHTFLAPSTNEFIEYDFEDITDNNGGNAQEQYDDSSLYGNEPLYYDLTSDNEFSTPKQHIRRQRQPQNINIQKFQPTDATNTKDTKSNILKGHTNQLPTSTLKLGYTNNKNRIPSFIPSPPKKPTRPTRPPKIIPSSAYPSSPIPPQPSYLSQKTVIPTLGHPAYTYPATLTPTAGAYNLPKRDRQRYGVRTNNSPKKWVSPYTRISTHGAANSDFSKYFPQKRRDVKPTTVTSWQSSVKTTPLRGLLQKFFPFSSERLS